MALQLGDTAPDFEADKTEGLIRFHDWRGDSWAVLFSHPKDFTPVCTTELGYMAKIKPEFDRRGVKVIGLSVDPLDRHSDWAKDIEETQGQTPRPQRGRCRPGREDPGAPGAPGPCGPEPRRGAAGNLLAAADRQSQGGA